MEGIFAEILNMSMISCIVIVAVMVIRQIFRRAPKAFFCILWAFVGFRLICPFTMQSVWCLIPDSQPIIEEVFLQETVPVKSEFPTEKYETSLPPIPYDNTEVQNDGKTPVYSVPTEENKSEVSLTETLQTPQENNGFLHFIPYIWSAGAILMFVGALIRYFLLIRRLHGSIADENGIYYSDKVDTPFILGVIFPKIYLPDGTGETDKEYILAHEKAHIHRLDYVWKPIGFMILCLHWFNPLVWVAFRLFCKDIELACDERVVRDYSQEKRKAYSHTLVNFSVQQKALNYLPLGFGESGVKERVVNVLSYKKPAFWVIMICIIVIAGISVFLMTNPVSSRNNTETMQNSEEESSVSEESDTYIFPADVPEEKAVLGKNGMSKITSRKFAEILSSSEFDDDIMKAVVSDDFEWNYDGYNQKIVDNTLWEKVFKSVQEIQHSADYIFTAEDRNTVPPENQVPMYYYWIDSNEQSERRISLSINYKAMVLTRIEYDEYGDVDSTQVIYSYPYELEKAAIKKYGCSEERNSRRLSNPYKKVICTSPVSPDNEKKLKGEKVLVPDEIANSPNTKRRTHYFNTIQKKYEEMASGMVVLNGKLEYQNQVAAAKAYPNMQKITADEIVAIFDKAKIYEGFDYENYENSYAWVQNNLKEIKKIQYFADVDANRTFDTYWLYWPDADTLEKRKQEVQIFADGFVRVAVYDENGNRISLEDVFDLQKKIQKMQAERIPFDEYPLKRKVTPEEVKAIFENAETDMNADYNDRNVCVEWTMKRIAEIEKIQPFPDWKTENANDTLFYCYWPDSNSVGERKSEIQINCETGTAILYTYENDVAHSETLFNLQEATKQ